MASDDELGGESFEDSSPLSPLQQGILSRTLTAAGGPSPIQIGASREASDSELFNTAWQKAVRTSFHAEEQEEVPLSFAQERLWFFEQLEPGKVVNNIGFCLEIRGALDVVALEKAATEMFRRHAGLRTVFLKRDGRPIGKVLPSQQINVPVRDLTQFPGPERACAALRMAETAAREAFDLASGPLLRLQLLKLASDHQWLVVTTHHIVCDEWSTAILYRELTVLYAASAAGQAAPLTPLTVQYHDYARWQRLRPAAEMEAAFGYWKQKLSGKLPVLDLPADRSRPAAQRYNGSVVPIHLPLELTRRLEAVARREDVTLDMLLLAAFKALLHRYTGQEDIIVGAPVAGRPLPETEPLIGMFVNILPMRTVLSSEMAFRDLLQRVRATALEASAHQQLPFERLVDALQLERDLSRSPVFQAMFVLQNAPTEIPAFAGTQLCARPLHTGTAKYDITVSLENTSEGLCGFVEFNSDLFDEATVQRFCGHFQTLLSGVVEDVTRCIGQLPLLTDAEREQILVTWNLTEQPFAQTKCVQDLFQEQVESSPEAIAAVFEDEQLTYRQLNDRANAVAAHLQALGAGPEARIGICIRRSLEMLVGLLGILKSGAAYVPLDPMYPSERLAFMLEDAQVHALLTERSLASDFAQAQTRVMSVEDIATSAVQKSVRSGAAPDDLAYVIYTSGSTGKPKGVMIRHRNVTNFFSGIDQVLGKTPGVWLAVTSICFDISVLELLWTVTRGFKVVIQSDEGGWRANTTRRTHHESYEIPDQIRRNAVTHFQCTPSLMGMLLQEKGAREAIASVNTILLGGEALPASLLEQLQPQQRIINMYGPTETTVWSTSQVIERGRPITIGRPMVNTKIYILDRFQQPTPIGIPGELYIGGAGVVRGYFNRPELTAERFVQNPFAGEPEQRMYHTGDLARYRPDGTIEFLGRLDHQVKLRGFRIELGEIEAALRQIAGIREAVVVVRELNANDKRLAAYLVADKTTDASQVRRALKDRLPDYMVPSLLTFLPKLPLTPNGKIDRKALPEPEGLRAAPSAAFAPAQSDTERRIAGIWRDILRVEQVGLNDNFFDLGGHSLLMVRAQAKIASVFGKEVPVLQLFQYPTIGALAKLLGESPRERMACDKIRDRARLQRQAFSWGARAEVAA
jgi:amino acid adenylation domain-containing protein